MAKVSLYLDKRRSKKGKLCPIKIVVNHKGKFMITTGIDINPDNFINNEIVAVRGAKTLNNILEQKVFEIKKLLLLLDSEGKLKKMSTEDLKKKVESINIIEPEQEEPYLFKDHLEKFLEEKNRKRTREIYQDTLRKISKFTDIETLLFEDITPQWLNSFDRFMSNFSINAKAIHHRNIRALFNHAINNDFIPQNLYPFRKFKIKREATIKRSLKVDDLVKLRDYPCEPHQEKYRDIFMLIFYLIGINIIDLLHLKEIKDNRIEFRRSKTGRLYSIEVLPEAMEIINKYRGKKYLLNPMDTYNDYKHFAKRLNMELQKIGKIEINEKGEKILIPILPNLTTYYARHTWATIAHTLNIPKDTIAAGLGHGGNTVTDIYIDFDRNKIDQANKKVLKHIKNKKAK